MNISVVLPAFNEETALRATVGRAVEALRPLFDAFEILIVDDCSRDATGRVADELSEEHPEVRVLHNPENLGQGRSLLRGFAQARYELVTHDAVDYPFDLCDLRLLVPLLSGADVVVATRRRRAGYTPYRTFLSATNRFLLRALFPLKLRDYNFVQVYRREVLEAVRVEAESTAFLTPALLIGAHDLGFRIAEVEVDYSPRTSGVARSGQLKVVLESVSDLLRFWLRRRMKSPQATAPEASEKASDRK